MGIKEITTGVVLTGLFMLALLTYTVSLTTENFASQSIENESFFSNYNQSLFQNLSNVREDAEKERNATQATEATKGDENFGLTSIPSMIFNFISMMFKTLQVLFTGATQVLSIPQLVVNVVIGVVVVIVAILSWAVFKAGRT